MLRMGLPRKMKRGRSKRRCMDVVREGMRVVELTEKEADYRTKWKWESRYGNPWRKKAK